MLFENTPFLSLARLSTLLMVAPLNCITHGRHDEDTGVLSRDSANSAGSEETAQLWVNTSEGISWALLAAGAASIYLLLARFGAVD